MQRGGLSSATTGAEPPFSTSAALCAAGDAGEVAQGADCRLRIPAIVVPKLFLTVWLLMPYFFSPTTTRTSHYESAASTGHYETGRVPVTAQGQQAAGTPRGACAPGCRAV